MDKSCMGHWQKSMFSMKHFSIVIRWNHWIVLCDVLLRLLLLFRTFLVCIWNVILILNSTPLFSSSFDDDLLLGIILLLHHSDDEVFLTKQRFLAVGCWHIQSWGIECQHHLVWKIEYIHKGQTPSEISHTEVNDQYSNIYVVKWNEQ